MRDRPQSGRSGPPAGEKEIGEARRKREEERAKRRDATQVALDELKKGMELDAEARRALQAALEESADEALRRLRQK